MVIEKLNMVVTVLNMQGDLNDHGGFEYVISHNEGIEVDFVLASGSIPYYEYTKLQVEDTNGNHRVKSGNEKQKEDGNGLITKKIRYFWDGGIIANTPLGGSN